MGFLDKLFPKRRSQYEGGNAALVLAMDALALAQNPENRKKMYELLVNSTILIPTPEHSSISTTEPDNVKLQLHFITDKWGRKLTPVFTDIEALRNWDPNTPVLENQAPRFFKFLLTNCPVFQGVVINPVAPNATKMIRPMAIIAAGEFEVLARGAIPHHEEAGLFGHQLPNSSLEIQPPTQILPPAAVETLSNSAGGFPEIANIYVFSIVLQALPPQLTVGLELDGAVTKERQQLIIQSLWGTIARALWGNVAPEQKTDIKGLDFVVLTGKIAAEAKHRGTKVYQRC